MLVQKIFLLGSSNLGKGFFGIVGDIGRLAPPGDSYLSAALTQDFCYRA